MEQHSLKRIAVIGLGYVGLPLCRLFIEKGHTVYGIDNDAVKLDRLKRKQSYLTDMSDDDIAGMTDSGRFVAGSSYKAIADADAVLICVPTPLDADFRPDISYVLGALKASLPYLHPGQLIVLESSTYPGTTDEVLKPLVESTGYRVGEQLYLTYSPERIDPGRQQITLKQIPKVVGGVTPACAELARSLYESVFDRVVVVSSARAAEMTKLVENCQRFVNISFMNELAMLCDRLRINLWECVEAAGTKPYGFMMYYPGPGVGGHCIPVDPMYLQWKAEQTGDKLKFIELAHEINERMPQFTTDKIAAALPSGDLQNKRLLVIGVTYKKDVNDVRESPALKVMDRLLQRGAVLQYFDPYIHELSLSGRTLQSVPLTEALLREQDCVLILTDHSGLPYELIADHSALIIDTRNATSRLGARPNIILL